MRQVLEVHARSHHAGGSAVDSGSNVHGTVGRSSARTDGSAPYRRPGPRSMPADMRSLLRRATGRYHRRLDTASVLAPLAQPGLTLGQYQQALLAMAQTYRAIDACLAQSPAGLVAPAGMIAAYVPHAPAMEGDLLAMGLAGAGARDPHGDARHRFMPFMPFMPSGPPAYLGMRYVIAGAQFGNRVIARNLETSFGALAGTICNSFLSAPAGNEEWRSILAALDALESRDDIAAAVRGARLVFRYFVLCLCPEEVS